ncbi:NADP-dependent 3-hydroxy acid dehydrogenase YdfG [Nonomuraea maritima]|uniref:NADP-dependent 3-hydroxy acid dehydrogenase YdfG n=1 Tax=Nonomuraea maritima TaxID=683260 RepID=A0A1G9H5P3_9ACTN|nr:SDR family oxidoreductase [Nonomuraea maritima]SDL07763.1 NADP-dependent 3-hydroxy acid dehydrogenase YdfG [Nonomuraea maritima]
MNTPKVVVITGASEGVGAALVSAYRELGYAVVANARSIAPSTDPMVRTVAGDIACPAVRANAIGEAVSAFGRVDTLVNHAGVFVAKPFTEYTEDDYARVTGVNLRGFFEISQRAIDVMLTHGGGHLVTVTASRDNGLPSALASLTRGGLDAVTRSLAAEYASQDIRVNAVTPAHAPGDGDVVDAIVHLETAELVTGVVVRVDGGR